MLGATRLLLSALAALPAFVLGCGGGDADKAAPSVETLPQRTATIETAGAGLVFRDRYFSFEMPTGWAQFVAETEKSFGTEEALGLALVSPETSSRISSVFVGAYDIAKVRDRFPNDIDTYVDAYAAGFDATVTKRPEPTALGEYAAHIASLAYDIGGSPVAATLVRALRGDVVYLVQCQAVEQDIDLITAGCRMIVDSFSTP